jgi:hypothetical protein
MIKIMSLLAVAAIAGVLLIAATRPPIFRVQRSISIKAHAERKRN